MAHSPHKNGKGCGYCKAHKRRGQGRGAREPWRVVRKLGKKRRLRRGDMGDRAE